MTKKEIRGSITVKLIHKQNKYLILKNYYVVNLKISKIKKIIQRTRRAEPVHIKKQLEKLSGNKRAASTEPPDPPANRPHPEPSINKPPPTTKAQ